MTSTFPLTYRASNKSIDIFLRTKTWSMDATHPAFTELLSLVKKGAVTSDEMSQIEKIFDIKKFVAKNSIGRVSYSDDTVTLDGVPVTGVIADRLLEMVKGGFDVTAMANFLANAAANPVDAAREQILLWLESSNMPLTSDGHFLAYKKVKSDYTSYYQNGTPVYNRIGDKPSMDRGDVDADRSRTCSAGLHFCSQAYLPHYYGNEGRVMVVKVNPADVVAIPNDYSNAKGRAWTYEVIAEMPEADAKVFFDATPVVTSFGTYEDWTDYDALDADDDALDALDEYEFDASEFDTFDDADARPAQLVADDDINNNSAVVHYEIDEIDGSTIEWYAHEVIAMVEAGGIDKVCDLLDVCHDTAVDIIRDSYSNSNVPKEHIVYTEYDLDGEKIEWTSSEVVAIVENGGLKKVAELLHVTTAAASTIVKDAYANS